MTYWVDPLGTASYYPAQFSVDISLMPYQHQVLEAAFHRAAAWITGAQVMNGYETVQEAVDWLAEKAREQMPPGFAEKDLQDRIDMLNEFARRLKGHRAAYLN